jgi:hypothetical protein
MYELYQGLETFLQQLRQELFSTLVAPIYTRLIKFNKLAAYFAMDPLWLAITLCLLMRGIQEL